MQLPSKNLLSDQTSPYLLQHKDNPVHWRPWSAAALGEARSLDRPVLLSVGYAACHWCHVMAHESFEDDDVAAVMNRLFVNIKVDREERPDIDQIYMTALSATGEQGGWPLTMFLTPDGKPFWGGTYFPRESRFGRPGFVEVLEAVHKAWTEKRDDLTRSADTLAAHVQTSLSPPSTATDLSAGQLPALADAIYDLIDHQKGGLRGAPKFPNAPFMRVLWLNWLENGNADHRDAVVHSLKAMLAGGIYDHVGGGLARYATDTDWLVPHFEKMLYDNAQLIRLAGWAYAATGDETFRIRIEETVEWLLREMRVEGRAFASSLDADSDGKEGLFYVWTRTQIENALGPDAEAYFKTFALASPPGWEGDPILHRRDHPDYEGADRERQLRANRDRLRDRRDERTRPGRDDKVLVDWNGLTIAALAEAGRLLRHEAWIEAAVEAFRFVTESMDGARLPHSIRDTKRLFPGLASDYAAMISAAVALYEATGDAGLIDHARGWLDELDRSYGDRTGTGYFLTAADGSDAPMRIRGDADDPVPSATGQTIEALVRLSSLTGDHALYDRAVRAAEAALGRAAGQSYGQAGIVYAAALATQPMKLVIVDKQPDRPFLSAANRIPDPRRVDVTMRGKAGSIGASLPAGAEADFSRPGAWLCTGQTCLPGIHDPRELEAVLRRPAPAG